MAVFSCMACSASEHVNFAKEAPFRLHRKIRQYPQGQQLWIGMQLSQINIGHKEILVEASNDRFDRGEACS